MEYRNKQIKDISDLVKIGAILTDTMHKVALKNHGNLEIKDIIQQTLETSILLKEEATYEMDGIVAHCKNCEHYANNDSKCEYCDDTYILETSKNVINYYTENNKLLLAAIKKYG